MTDMDWHNKRILVLGLGDTGVSLLAFLRSQGAQVTGFDAQLTAARRDFILAQWPDMVLRSGSLSEAMADGFDVLALSPGVPSRLPEITAFARAGGEVLGDVELFARLVAPTNSKVIAITGSNGKTTVTSLVGFLCEQLGLDTVVAGNIGLPVLEAWQQRSGKLPDVWVLELSSFQLDTTRSLNATAATVLNISEDHLDRYDDLLDYAHSKDRIFHGDGVQVLNADDVFCRAMQRPQRPVRWVSLAREADYWVDVRLPETALKAGQQVLLPTAKLSLQGLHNAANALVAVALCEAIGLPREALLAKLPEFKGLPHRVELVGELNGVRFIDDSKGTNVGATCAALSGLPQPIVLIAGGLGKGQDFTPLQAALTDKARAVVLIGRDAALIQAALGDLPVPIERCDSLVQATERAYALARPGDIVLLSPACASFDMFQGYAHRAQVFIESFQRLPRA